MRKLISFVILTVGLIAFGQQYVEKQEVQNINVLSNAGFESGKTNWTISVSSTATVSTTSPIQGAASLIFDSTAASQTVRTALYSLPTTKKTGSVSECQGSIRYLTTENTNKYIFRALDSSDVVLASNTLDAVTVATQSNLFFTCSTQARLEVISSGNGASIKLDSAHLGTRKDVISADITDALGYTPVASVSVTSPISLTGGASNPVIGLQTSGITSGSTYTKVTVDGYGRATSGTTLINSDFPDSGVSANTYTKVAVNSKGVITSGTTLIESDIPSLQTTKITSGIFSVANGGTGVSMTSTGSLLVGSGTAFVNLGPGAAGTVLTSTSSGALQWAVVSSTATFNNVTLSGTTVVSGTFVSGYANYGNVSATVLTSQRFITLSNSGTTVTFTLPTTGVSTGTQITFVRNVTTAATQSIISVGTGNLCGNLTSVKLSGVNDSMTFFYDGANWKSPDCYRTVSYTTNSGCTTVGQIVGNAALSASSGGTGQCSVTMYSGIFSSTPNCLVNTSAQSSSSGEVAIGIVNEATTNFAWYQSQPGVGPVNRFSFVTCNGPR